MSNGNHRIDLDYSDGPEGEIDYDAYDEELQRDLHAEAGPVTEDAGTVPRLWSE